MGLVQGQRDLWYLSVVELGFKLGSLVPEKSPYSLTIYLLNASPFLTSLDYSSY